MPFFFHTTFFLTILISYTSYSQSYSTDSLLAKKFQIKADSFSEVSQFDSSILYFEKASTIYEKYKMTASYLSCLNRIGWRFFLKGNWNKSLQIYYQALTIEKSDTTLYVKAICQSGISSLTPEYRQKDFYTMPSLNKILSAPPLLELLELKADIYSTNLSLQ